MMNKNSKYSILWVCVVFVISLCGASSFVQSPDNLDGKPLSPTDFVIDSANNQLIIAQKTGLRIDMVDLESGKLKKSIPTNKPPTGVCMGEADMAYVTCSHSLGEVMVLNVKSGELIAMIRAGHGANSPVYSSSKKRLYVANQYDDDVSVIDLKTGNEISRINVLRQPMVMDITPDGQWLYVANLLPATRADIDTVAADVSILDLEKNKAIKHLKLSNGSNALRGIKISPDGRHGFVSHNLGRFQVPTSQLEQGWMNTSALSILNVVDQKVMATVLLDEPEHGAASSWGIDVTDEVIVVNHSGTHDFSLINYPSMMEKLNEVDDPDVLSYDLTFLNDIRKRFPFEGEGPRAVRIDRGKIYAALYFSDKISINDIDNGKMIGELVLNSKLAIDSVRLGEMAFNDARHCFQQWQACTGCHPNDARTDALNWDLLNDGIGNPKNCKSMLYAHETPPSMITGIRPTAEVAVRAGFRHIQFAQIEDGKAKAVDFYLKSLRPVPSPHLVDGELSEKAKRGKMIFEKVRCNFCHSGAYFTDGKKHEIGVPGQADRNTSWDTPTLIEVWRTGPYLHDGRSATMKEMFVNDKHGLEKELPDNELESLIEYVLSL